MVNSFYISLILIDLVFKNLTGLKDEQEEKHNPKKPTPQTNEANLTGTGGMSQADYAKFLQLQQQQQMMNMNMMYPNMMNQQINNQNFGAQMQAGMHQNMPTMGGMNPYMVNMMQMMALQQQQMQNMNLQMNQMTNMMNMGMNNLQGSIPTIYPQMMGNVGTTGLNNITGLEALNTMGSMGNIGGLQTQNPLGNIQQTIPTLNLGNVNNLGGNQMGQLSDRNSMPYQKQNSSSSLDLKAATSTGIGSVSSMSEVDRAINKINLTEPEVRYYTQCYNAAKAPGKDVLGVAETTSFLKRSNLDKSALSKIWNMTIPKGTIGISFKEFTILLRLISLQQQGMVISY